MFVPFLDHNRVHATDVVHGVYYLTTQPIPGFHQVSTTDVFARQASSSESGMVWSALFKPFPPFTTNAICLLITLYITLVAYIANNMDPNQTAP